MTVAIHAARPLYQTYALLVAAYAVMFLPQAIVTVRAALEQAPPIFEDVSRSLGSGMVATARRVTLPLIMPGLASAAALVFVAVVTELTATLLLAPIGTATLATQFWSETGSVHTAPRPRTPAHGARLGACCAAAQPTASEAGRMTALTVRGLSHSFADHRVLTGLDLDVAASSVTALLGPSGCGKTTLLRIVAGFLDADAGTIHFDDRVVVGAGRSVPARRRRVGYVPQEGALFPHLTVAANIGFGLRRRGHDRARIDAALDLVELPQRVRDHYPHELSGGQQQRVALARALAPEPAIVLLDEPFSSLDAGLRESTGLAVVRALRAATATAVLVTHDQTEALSLADQVAVMRDGRIAQLDRPVDLYRVPADPDIARFVGGASVLTATVRGGVARCALGDVDVAGAVDADDVVVVVRPEQIHVSAHHGVDEGRAGRTQARVDSVSYYGHDASVRLDVLPDGPRVIARVEGREPPEAGALVHVHVVGRSPVFARPAVAPTDGPSE